MWIFGHNRSNYGIKYLYDSTTNGTADKIEFHGGHATNTTAWIQLDTGNTSIGGTLNVTGASTLSGNTTVGGTLNVTGNATFNDIYLNNEKDIYMYNSSTSYPVLLNTGSNNGYN